MKTPEEMMAYFKSMPKKDVRKNPYWEFVGEPEIIRSKIHMISPCTETKPINLKASRTLLITVREFFRRYYESFHSEAQVLCVTPEDGKKLAHIGIPILTHGTLEPFDVTVVILPQDNHGGTSVISEWFWQNRIVDAGIIPVARIHSHHVLDPYQSITDYSTLNSGTLEMVIGRIFCDELNLCYWLDVPGTDNKAHTIIAQENAFGDFMWIHRQFNGLDKDLVLPKN